MQKLWKVYEIGKDMLKIDFTTSELNKIKEEVVFSDLQERIIELKRKEWSNTQICMELSISQSKLSKEIKKVNLNNKESIKRYNEFKANLRSQLEFEEE